MTILQSGPNFFLAIRLQVLLCQAEKQEEYLHFPYFEASSLMQLNPTPVSPREKSSMNGKCPCYSFGIDPSIWPIYPSSSTSVLFIDGHSLFTHLAIKLIFDLLSSSLFLPRLTDRRAHDPRITEPANARLIVWLRRRCMLDH
jgi:hypothetical protein